MPEDLSAVTVAETSTGLGLRCGTCSAIVAGLAPGDSLPELIRTVRSHQDAFHHPQGYAFVCGPGTTQPAS